MTDFCGKKGWSVKGKSVCFLPVETLADSTDIVRQQEMAAGS